MNAPARPRLVSTSGLLLILVVVTCLVAFTAFVLMNRNVQVWNPVDDSTQVQTNEAAPAADAAPAVPETSGFRTITAINAYGCMDPFTHDRIQSFAKADDSVGFESALTRMIANGGCARFQAGETVVQFGAAMIPGMVQIRRPGEGNRYWMTALSVK